MRQSDQEKKQIEQEAARSFLREYNLLQDTKFAIVELADAPDVRCADMDGSELRLEVTLMQDKPRDIQAALGRSDHKNLDELIKYMNSTERACDPFRWASSSVEVVQTAIAAILQKLTMDYGANVALVVWDISPLPWHWGRYLDDITEQLAGRRNPFDKGIWILKTLPSRIWRVV